MNNMEFVAAGGFANPYLGANAMGVGSRNDPWIKVPVPGSAPIGAFQDYWVPNQAVYGSSGGFGGGFSSSGGGGNGSSFSSNANTRFGGSSVGDVFSNVSGGGSVNFGNNVPDGFNPYQFTPVFQNLQRPESPVAPLTPEEEYLRQYQMGLLLGDQPGYDTAYNELLNTVSGEYLHPDSNPYLSEQINAAGADTTNFLNRAINDILSRAGSQGALGGSRSALLQGQAGGEATRGFNEVISNLLSSNYQTERNRQLGAIPGLLDVENLPVAQAAQAMGLAGIPREMQQQLINAQMGELLRMQNERLMPLQVGQSVLGQRMGQTVPIVSQQPSTLQQLSGLASGVGGLLGGIGNLGKGLGSLGNIFGGTANASSNIPTGGFWGTGSEFPDAAQGSTYGGFIGDAWDSLLGEGFSNTIGNTFGPLMSFWV